MDKLSANQIISPFQKAEDKVRETLEIVKNFYSIHLWNKWASAYRNYFMYKLDRALLVKDFQTNIKSPVVKMYVDAMWTGLYDNVINFRVVGRDRDDQKKADDVKAFLEWWFSASNSRMELMQAIKEALICWPWYLKIGFVDREKKIEYKKWLKKVTKVTKEQYPFVRYVPIFNIFIDPTVKSFEESPYVFERNIMTVEAFKKYYGNYFNNKTEPIIKYALKNPYYFSGYDYNKIKHAAFWDEREIKKFFNSYIENNNNDWGTFDVFTQNYLSFEQNSKYVEVIEYWSDERHITLVNGKAFLDEENPLPLKKKPYVDIEYNKAPGLAFGSGLGVTLEDIQNITDELLNLQMDNTKFQIAPMFQKLKGSDMFSQDASGLLYEPFKVVEVNTPEGMHRLELGSPEFTGVDMIQFLLQLWEMSEGLNSYSMWYQNKVERSATGVSALVQAFKSRLLPLVESMNQALAKIAEMWTATAVVMMDDMIAIRQMSKDGKPVFRDISIDDLVGKYDIEFDAQALKSATREIKRDQLLQLLNTAINWWVDPNTGEYFIDMRELWREIIDSFEMSQDLVMNTKEVNKEKTKSMILQAKAEQQVQQAVQAGQMQAPNQQQQMAMWSEWAPEPGMAQTWIEQEQMANWIYAGNDIVQNVEQNIPPEAGLQMEWDILNRVMA